MPSYQQELVTVRMTLGELTFAHRAVAHCYHIQDQLTGELIQIPYEKPESVYAKVNRRMRFYWGHSKWMRPVFGVLAALTLIVLIGMIQAWRDRVYGPEIPIALAPRIEPKKLAVVEEPYQQPEEREVPEQAVSNQLLGPLPPAISQRIPTGASKVAPTLPSPQIVPPDIKPVQGEKQVDTITVVNELPAESKAVAKSTMAVTASTSSQAPAPAPTPAPAPKVSAYKPQLVAIQDQKNILVTSPTSRLPMKVSTGGLMPDGRKLEKIDLTTGTATFEDGSSIRLE